ncbi:MAG: DUF3603 family protein [Firmicutes bacterium]|nr:DUF3603 family protein [Bacillota bacterium]
MIYIYDLLLNFIDSNRLIEFYEWSSNDIYDQVKKIPLFRINSIDMENIINGNIKVDNKFLTMINNKTYLYKNKKTIKYATLFSDLNRVVAIEFDSNGKSIFKSSLLLDEEEDVLEDSFNLDIFNLNYKVLDKYKQNFLTREEVLKKRYLIKELETLYENKDYDKLNYLYEEVFESDNNNIKNRYYLIIEDINNNYTDKYNKLYEIVRLSYQKK